MDRHKAGAAVTRNTTIQQQISSRTRALLYILAFGVTGAVLMSVLMLMVDQDKLQTSERVNNIMSNVSELLAAPGLLFFIVVIVYSVSELYKIYQRVNDPAHYGQGRNKANNTVARERSRNAKPKPGLTVRGNRKKRNRQTPLSN